MNTTHQREVERICQAALDRAPQLRPAFLEEACGGDAPLRRDVESLLAEAPGAERFLEAPGEPADAPNVAEPMALIGWSIGPYRVVSWLGTGGMGDVYQAHDAKLERDVALKVLPASCAPEGDLLARFRREAKVLASLGHANIAAIYGFEESGDVHALVLELVEGPTLAERIARGAIPLDEALSMAMQIAGALEAAHERGVVHRDLKPANIKLRPDGVVKILDFGIAKAVEPPHVASAGLPPAVKTTLTQPGLILGTAAYMSPEQARGLVVDKRTDVWAFGCVLFEMLTGQQAFAAETVTDTMAAVIGADPDWSALSATTPSAIVRLLRRALTKDPRNRLADAAMARLEIEEASRAPDNQAPAATAAAVAHSHWREWVAWTLVAVSMVTAAGLAVPAARYLRGTAAAAPTRFFIDIPSGRHVSISPDGRTVTYVAEAQAGGRMLYVRAMNAVDARPLAGTQGAFAAFWSPDSRSIGVQIGYGPNATLKRVEASGGPVQSVARCGIGTWSRDGIIVCSDGQSLFRVAATGGALTRVTNLDASLQETWHSFPYFLPDGRHFLYLAWSAQPENRAIYAGSLDSNQKTRVMTAESRVTYVSPGYLLFHRQGTLFAQAFDAARLELQGEAVRLVAGIDLSDSGTFDGSSTGTLVYRSDEVGQLAWFNRQGRRVATVGPAGVRPGVALSPDEAMVAFPRTSPDGSLDIWTVHLSTGISSRLTTDPANEGEPIWSPDSRGVLFSSNRTGKTEVFQRTLGTTQDVHVFQSAEGNQWPDDWSRDGTTILINDRNAGIVALTATGERTSTRVLLSPSGVIDYAQFSPDGRWVAYASTESGQPEIRVASFPVFENVRQVSAGGGHAPRWRRDGKELFYMTGDGQIMAVGVSMTGSRLDTTAPTKLFATATRVGTPGGRPFAVSGDGTRFLVLDYLPGSEPRRISVVLNWMGMLQQGTPVYR